MFADVNGSSVRVLQAQPVPRDRLGQLRWLPGSAGPIGSQGATGVFM